MANLFKWTVVSDTKERRYFRWEALSNSSYKGVLLDTNSSNSIQVIADANSWTPQALLGQVRNEYLRQNKDTALVKQQLPTYSEYMNAYGCRNCDR